MASATLNYRTYVVVWLGLIVLTGLTISISGLKLGLLGGIGALAIASVKSALVLLFFMHLRYENRLFRIMVLFSVITLVIIIGFTFFDVSYR